MVGKLLCLLLGYSNSPKLANMKTKVFLFSTDVDFLILATARIIGEKCLVSYCMSNSQKLVNAYDLAGVKLDHVEKWANKNGASLWS